MLPCCFFLPKAYKPVNILFLIIPELLELSPPPFFFVWATIIKGNVFHSLKRVSASFIQWRLQSAIGMAHHPFKADSKCQGRQSLESGLQRSQVLGSLGKPTTTATEQRWGEVFCLLCRDICVCCMVQVLANWKVVHIANGNNIITSAELNCLGLPWMRHTFRLEGGKLQGVIMSVKFFLPAFSAGKVELNPW